jgi:hypothetical protein
MQKYIRKSTSNRAKPDIVQAEQVNIAELLELRTFDSRKFEKTFIGQLVSAGKIVYEDDIFHIPSICLNMSIDDGSYVVLSADGDV